MFSRTLRLPSILLAACAMAPALAWGVGFELGETKEQLKLVYDVTASDPGTGSVTVTLAIADQGRIKPIRSIDLDIPREDGSGYFDMSVTVATREEDGKQVAIVHLKKEWAERAQFRLVTGHLDGKQSPRTWCYHLVPIGKFLEPAEPTPK